MKKIFFASLYFIHLLCFNILILFFLAVLEVSVLSNLKMIRGIYSDNLILILLNIFLSYFYVKAGIGKKALIILTIIGVILKILIFLISYKYLVSSAGDEEFLPTYYAYFAIGLLDVIFLVGLGVNLLIGRRKQHDKNKKLTGFMIFLLFGMIFISCGKPLKKDIIDKGYILEVGVSNEIDREFAGKMEHSPTYTIFKATEYKDNDIMVQNLKNGTVKAILSPMLSLGNSDYGYYPVYVDNKNYETVYLIYRKDIPDFLKNSFEKGDSFMLNNMEKYSKEKYKDRFSFFSNIENFEKKIMANEWALVNIAGFELKNSKISIKLDKGNVVITGKNGKKYLGKYFLKNHRISFEIDNLNNLMEKWSELTNSDKDFLDDLSNADVITLMNSEQTLYIGVPESNLVFKKTSKNK